MLRLLSATVVATGVLTAHIAANAGPAEDEIVSPILSEMALIDSSGQIARRPEPGAALRIRLTLTNQVNRSPWRLGASRSFVRVLDGDPANCAARIRMFRATGAVSSLDHALEGSLILSLSLDDHLSLVDPNRPQSSNTLALRKAAVDNPHLAADPATGLIFLQQGERGPIYRVSLPDLDQRLVDGPHHGLLHFDGAGAVVIGDRRITRIQDGAAGRSIALPDGAWRAGLAGPVPVLVDGKGGALVVPATRAERFVPVRMKDGFQPLAASHDGSLVIAGGPESKLHLHFTGADQAIEVATGKPIVAAWVAPDRRHVLALHDNRRTLVVIDAASGEAVQAAALERSVRGVAFAGDAAFVQLDSSSVLKIAAASLGRGRQLDFVKAAVPAPELEHITDDTLAGLSVLPDGGGVLAPGFGSDRVAILAGAGHAGLNARPATIAIPLRTGRFRAAVAVSRGFAEKAPGVYEAPFVARAAGQHLLVIADGAGQFSACHAFDIGNRDAERASAGASRLLLDKAESRIAAAQGSRIVFRTSSGTETVDQVPLEVMDMGSPWRSRAMALRRDGGGYAVEFTFPRAGTYVLQPRLAQPLPAFEKPLVISVTPEDRR